MFVIHTPCGRLWEIFDVDLEQLEPDDPELFSVYELETGARLLEGDLCHHCFQPLSLETLEEFDWVT